ncbi:hypothetical protein vseg_006012 [Gypsophila vaccaria]
MVELKVDQHFPKSVSFKDEQGELIKIEVEYEWKPVNCNSCKGMEHQTDQCRKIPQKPKTGDVGKKHVIKNGQAEKKMWRPIIKNGEAGKAPDKIKEKLTTEIIPTVTKQNEDREGYSSNTFGSISYRDALSPSQQPSSKTGNAKQNNQVYGQNRVLEH